MCDRIVRKSGFVMRCIKIAASIYWQLLVAARIYRFFRGKKCGYVYTYPLQEDG
jgi:hypothetical protein